MPSPPGPELPRTPTPESIASSAGGLAILTFDAAQEALDFSHAARAALANNGLSVRVGIDAGSVLLFQNASGPGGITGDPVNIASKLSEDAGGGGYINLTDRALRRLSAAPAGELFKIEISGVALTGITLT